MKKKDARRLVELGHSGGQWIAAGARRVARPAARGVERRERDRAHNPQRNGQRNTIYSTVCRRVAGVSGTGRAGIINRFNDLFHI